MYMYGYYIVTKFAYKYFYNVGLDWTRHIELLENLFVESNGFHFS